MTNLSGANLNSGVAVGPKGEGMDSPSSFPAYPTYKDSGVEWAGALPVEWQILKLKRAARLQSGEFITSEAIEEDAQYPVYGGNGLRGYTVAYTHDGEFALIGRQGALCGNINYTEGKFWASEHAVVVYPEKGIVTRWLGELLRSMNLGQYSVSAAQPGLSVERIADLFIPVPSPIEQTQIARFLDHETARIDALIEEQQRLIELLKEKRQAVISHAVTKGLDPTVPMKDSGVEWLGEVPAHWDVCSVRRVISAIEQGWSPECEANPTDEDAWGVLKAGCVNRGVFDPSENKTLPAWLEPVAEYEVRAGDILMSRASGSPELVGSTVLLGEVRGKLMLSDKIFRIHLEAKISSSFFVWVMNAQFMRAQIEQALSGGNGLANNLPQSSLLAFWLAVPPSHEQVAIAEYINKLAGEIDALISEGGSAVELLQERRAALISAAVTGKIDVRGWQPTASIQAPEPAVAEAN